MSDSAFADTNVLIYAVLDNGSKTEAAQSIAAAGPTISVQVLNEFTAVSRRKFGKSWEDIDEALHLLRTLASTVRPVTIETHELAVKIAANHDLNIYDAAIVASASDCGCSILYTEDMQHGQLIQGVRIVNPFLAA